MIASFDGRFSLILSFLIRVIRVHPRLIPFRSVPIRVHL